MYTKSPPIKGVSSSQTFSTPKMKNQLFAKVTATTLAQTKFLSCPMIQNDIAEYPATSFSSMLNCC